MIVSGDGQVGYVGLELRDPLVVRALDDKGKPIKGQIVSFVVVRGGGTMFAGVSITNNDGLAQDFLTLGPTSLDNVVEARAVDPTTGEKLIFARFTARSVVNFALDFNDDYVTVPDHTDLDLSATWTIEAWVKPHNLSFPQHIVSKWNGGGDASYVLEISTAGGLRSAIHDDVNPTQVVESFGSLAANAWQHVAITLDNGTLRLYIGGALDRTFTGSQTPMNSTRPVSFGREGPPFGDWRYDGQIDEVRIWNIARTGPEIADYVDVRLGGSEAGLVGYWRFDEGDGDFIGDSTARGHDGVGGNGIGRDSYDPQWTTDAAPIR
jgi:hypothetical protein